MGYRIHLAVKGNYIDGQFQVSSDPSGEWIVKSPADQADEIGRFQFSYRAIDESVHAARAGFSVWQRTKYEEREAAIKRFRSAIERKKTALSEAISREIGRPLWETEIEVDAVLGKIDAVLADGLHWAGDFEISKVLDSALGACRRRPHGVAVVVGPFNFPLSLPCSHIIPALLTGNSVILKPSEKAPMTGQLIAEAFHEAELPAGVFNCVQGDKEVSRRLCAHDQVDSIFFTGSYEVGTRIKQDTLLQHWKLVALQMGGKNSVVIWNDADVEVALQDSFIAAFISAGQRCTATSRVIIHESLVEAFVEKLHQRAKAFSIGHPLANPFMGPLIDAGAVDRYMKFQGIAVREGCEMVMRGKTLELEKQGHYVAPSICWVKNATLEGSKKSVYQQAEIFGPNLGILAVRDLDEAIAQANVTQYGLVASVYSANRTVFDKCWEGLRMGVVNWNRPTTDVSARLPFGGVKKSGNHFSAGAFSVQNCTYPVASIEDSEPRSRNQNLPGLNWK